MLLCMIGTVDNKKATNALALPHLRLQLRDGRGRGEVRLRLSSHSETTGFKGGSKTLRYCQRNDRSLVRLLESLFGRRAYASKPSTRDADRSQGSSTISCNEAGGWQSRPVHLAPRDPSARQAGNGLEMNVLHTKPRRRILQVALCAHTIRGGLAREKSPKRQG